MRVVRKFGGVASMQAALKNVGLEIDRSTIFKWFGDRSRGNGGRIPATMWEDILAAAQIEGIFLTSEDLDPRPYTAKDTPRLAQDYLDDPYYGGHQDAEFQDNPEIVAMKIPNQWFDIKHRGRKKPRGYKE